MTDCPETIEEAVEMILASLSKTDIAAIRNLERASMLHLSLGAEIRNSWIHHQECLTLYEDIWAKHNHLGGWLEDDDDYIGDPDELSAVILEALWQRLRN